MNRRWLGFFGILLIAGVLFAGCAQPAEEKPKEAAPSKPAEVEVPLGVLVDLSGPLTTYGEDIKMTVTIASENLNAYFEEQGKPYRVKLYVEDTKVDPKIALDKVMALHSKGVKLIVGPMGSGEVKNILEYVRSNKMIIASPSSTADPKYIGVTSPEEKKYIFRFVATDSFQTKAIAKLAQELGVKAVVITYIGNAWGKGLNEFGSSEFEKLGIEVKSSVEYPDPPPADFTPYVATIEEAVNDLLKKYSKDEIAVVAFSYEEVATMLAQVKDDSVLLSVKWIGCDGTAKSKKVIEDVADKANRVKLYSTVSETRGGAAYEELKKVYEERTGGKTPISYGLNAYDAAWVLTLAFAEVYDKQGKYDADAIAEAIPSVAERYSRGEYGVEPVSGEVKFDEYNDRVGSEYRIYAVKEGSWAEVGVWKFATNSIEWSG
ncbi:MAG: ABC transporter substrate-binding protein [Euryarchaeota archaeon]|nr:ABC transporter substrate-binding protein [Euryarchaeota archaeon]